jgi:hypothetical protein
MLVHQVEQDLLVSGDVQPRIAPKVVYESSLFNLIITDPSFLIMMVVINQLEEKDGCRTFDHESAFIKQIHRPEIFIRDLVDEYIMKVLLVHRDRQALPVE